MTPTDYERETARMIEAVLLEWDQEREAAIRVAGRIATLLASRREGWVSVTERLPKDEQRVLVLHPYGVMYTAQFLVAKTGSFFAPECEDLEESCAETRRPQSVCASFDEQPTHWRPLPTPPEVKP